MNLWLNKEHPNEDITKCLRRSKNGQFIIQAILEVRSGQCWEGRGMKVGFLGAIITELRARAK